LHSHHKGLLFRAEYRFTGGCVTLVGLEYSEPLADIFKQNKLGLTDEERIKTQSHEDLQLSSIIFQ